MTSANELAAVEANRLRQLLFDCGVSESQVSLLDTVIEQTAWMKAKLDETRVQIGETQVAIPYDNGGGQTGIRENPLFKGYSALWKSYMSGIEKILAALPEDLQEEAKPDEEAKPRTVLELVREKRGA